MRKTVKREPDAYAAWFARRLRDALEENGQTQAGLLEILQENNYPLIQSRLSHYMQGRRYPDPPILAELARAIGVSSDYLLGLTEERASVAALGEMLAKAKGESKIDKIMEKLPPAEQEQVMNFAEYRLAQTARLKITPGGKRTGLEAALNVYQRKHGQPATDDLLDFIAAHFPSLAHLLDDDAPPNRRMNKS